MPRTIQLAAALPAPPDLLFDMYLDPKAHAAFTGAPVSIDSYAGVEFTAFNGTLLGTILQVIPKRLIVQSWRATHWMDSDIDSTLILSFWPEGNASRACARQGGRSRLCRGERGLGDLLLDALAKLPDYALLPESERIERGTGRRFLTRKHSRRREGITWTRATSYWHK
ncbi:MAG: SRPBCC domain-containing protein [Desulfomonilaceae bacterium]